MYGDFSLVEAYKELWVNCVKAAQLWPKDEGFQRNSQEAQMRYVLAEALAYRGLL